MAYVSAIYILTIKVHRHNTCFLKKCTGVKVGGTHNDVRRKSEKRLEAKQAEAAVEQDTAVQVRVQLQQHTLQMQEKRLELDLMMGRESILSSRTKRETAAVENKRKQLKLLQKHKDVYVHKFGQDAYDEKVGELLESVVMTNTGTHGDDLYFGGGGGDNIINPKEQGNNAGNGNTDNGTIATNEE